MNGLINATKDNRTFVRAIVEDVTSFHGFIAPLFVTEDEIDPVMKTV